MVSVKLKDLQGQLQTKSPQASPGGTSGERRVKAKRVAVLCERNKWEKISQPRTNTLSLPSIAAFVKKKKKKDGRAKRSFPVHIQVALPLTKCLKKKNNN